MSTPDAQAGSPARAVVVVSYGSHSLLAASLAPLDLAALGARVVVVDNWHSPAERAAVSGLAARHGWSLLPVGTNTGFGHAANAGVARAAELGASSYVLLNPDAQATTAALRRLFEHVEREPMTLVAPRILRADGSVWFDGARVDVRAGRTRSATGASTGPDGWLTGACLAVHAQLWAAVGGFDLDYFLYWEDVDLSWRVREAGGLLTVRSDVSVTHDVGGTQRTAHGSTAKSPVYVRYNCRNRLLFAARHLDGRTRLRWLAVTVPYASEVLQRGGRRALARDAWRLGLAAVRGSAEGTLQVLRPGAAPGRDRRALGATRYARVRLYESVRTAHLERAHALTPASILYGQRRYDFDESLAAGLDLRRAGLVRTAQVLWRSDVRAVEVNEPLMTSGLRRAAVAIAVLRLRHPRARVVSYAIENKAPARAAGPGGVKSLLRDILERTLRAFVWRGLDRLAFGTQAAQDLYADLLPARGASLQTALFPAVPRPCDCGRLDDKDPDQVLFLGALTQRKGFPLLAQAWPAVAARRPRARLVVVGKGELEEAARELSSTASSITLDVDPPREQVHARLRRASVLVLPSQATPTWREQVGLPVVEGLAHGCTVVTTTETGLASWLAAHGHEVIRSGGTPDELAEAVERALDAHRPAPAVLADLPDVDARLAADRWLFQDAGDEPGASR